MTASDSPAMTDPLDAEPLGETAIADFARILRADIESGSSSTLTVLLRAARLARGANIGRMERWLDCELRGYSADADDTDELMTLSRRWQDADARVGYMEPLPAIESRITMLTERLERLEAELPPLPADADPRLVAVQVALVERMAARAERERRKLVAQLGDLEAIRSSVYTLLHGFVDRMCAFRGEPPQAQESPSNTLEEDDDAVDDGFEAGVAEDDESLPEAMLTDDAALDELIDSIGDATPETLNTVVEDWDRIIKDDGVEETGMSPEELAEFLDDVLGPPSLDTPEDEDTGVEPEPEPEPETEDSQEPVQEIAPTADEIAGDNIEPDNIEPDNIEPDNIEPETVDSQSDSIATLVREFESLRDQMDEADAQEAVEAAGACSAALGRLAETLTDETAVADPQAALLAIIDTQSIDDETVFELKALINSLFDRLIEVEIGGDAERMKENCEEALHLVDELTNR